MSALGRNATAILAQYFPGAEAVDETTGRAWRSLKANGFVVETLDPADSAFVPVLAQALNDSQSRSGIKATQSITVRAFHSTPAFRDATLAPGWVAAFTEGNWIATQPLATLASRKLLYATLRHEFLHTLIESQAAPTTPLWLREGLVETMGGHSIPAGPVPALKLEEVDRALSHASTEAESQAAHRAAEWYARRLLARSGREQVLQWLRNGLPGNALTGIQ